MWHNFKSSNIPVTGVVKIEERDRAGEEEEGEDEHRKIFEEIMLADFHNFMKTINQQIQDTQQMPSIGNMKKIITKHHN